MGLGLRVGVGKPSLAPVRSPCSAQAPRHSQQNSYRHEHVMCIHLSEKGFQGEGLGLRSGFNRTYEDHHRLWKIRYRITPWGLGLRAGTKVRAGLGFRAGAKVRVLGRVRVCTRGSSLWAVCIWGTVWSWPGSSSCSHSLRCSSSPTCRMTNPRRVRAHRPVSITQETTQVWEALAWIPVKDFPTETPQGSQHLGERAELR